ncbi:MULTISPECIES: ADP-ribosyltransferase [unclassified Methanoregula]|uniref:ADP-ribosyltransferase n=1 Tax=unclassified Methanoregula TaxID=2649730 RepID=UPI0009C5C4D0|nr:MULTISPECIES: hypothetical protein [unclassified Methanoregula]OPX63925.1 MAG: hypothetical protein A4E33_01455 [Methanoregula sp. PtaB.Bin085]OPY35477.1 MAG: hypothetical protein A4E34_00752 [Methanoregula sp. PtaU1.Bin006]
MASRQHTRSRTGCLPAGIIILALACFLLICGCLQVEPEELPPETPAIPVTIAESPALTPTPGTTVAIPPAISITRPRLTGLFSAQDFPAEVKAAVMEYSSGKTSDTLNSYLRWESVRARTSKQDAATIREQISRIDYAMYNTSLKENISLFIPLSADQARKVRNESVFSENSYILASYDPSVIYHRFAERSRDNDGYFTMCVIDFRPGSHPLWINETEREFVLPRGGIWDVAGEDTYEKLRFAADSIPRYDDIVLTKVRIIRTKEHP